mmetsp:Transcript_42432/g.65108  ORF Transcript_42432/g.65108 Transcript_42432/m.65108 type:complete len:133 (+) Transcript_42432:552-950(+)
MLKNSLVCLDDSIWSELIFWKDDKCDILNTTLYDFHKLKVSAHQVEGENPVELGIPGNKKFWLLVNVGLDSQKEVTVVKSYKLLEFLGDLGGFVEMTSVIFAVVGGYLATKMLRAEMIRSKIKIKKPARGSK